MSGGFVVGPDGEAQDYDEWANTEFGPQIAAQAWSAGKQPAEPVHYRAHHRWRKALLWAGTVVGLGAMTALLVGIAGSLMAKADEHNAWPTGYTNPPSPTPANPAPTDVPPPPAGPFVANWNVAGEITHDGAFLHRLYVDIPRPDMDIIPDVAINNAHIECNNAARGFSVNYMVAWMIAVHDPAADGLSPAQIRTMLYDDIEFYCPGLG